MVYELIPYASENVASQGAGETLRSQEYGGLREPTSTRTNAKKMAKPVPDRIPSCTSHINKNKGFLKSCVAG